MMEASCLIAIFASLICHVISVDPIVAITEPMTQPGVRITRAIKDQSFDFLCEIKNKPADLTVLWYRGDENIAHDQTPDNPAEHSVFKPSPQQWKLRLKNVKLSDANKYTCKVETRPRNFKEDYRILEVVDPPRINNLETSSDLVVEEGRPMDLHCAATGIPEPVIRWTRLADADLPNGGKLYQKPDLLVEAVRRDHRGKYICTAMNNAGVDQRIINVRIIFEPHTTAEAEIVYQAPGYRVELLCDIQAYPSLEPGQTGWSKENSLIDFESTAYTTVFSRGANDRVTTKLTIHSVQPHDYGTYICFGRGQGRDNRMVENKAQIELRRATEPQKDRVGEIRSGAAIFTFSLMTMVMLLSVCILHH